MGISRLKPDEAPVHTQTLPVTAGPSMSQVLDLGSIRVAYVELSVTGYDLDSLVLGASPGSVFFRSFNGGDPNPTASRDGAAYVEFDVNTLNTDYNDAEVPLPFVLQTSFGISPRYLKVEGFIFDADSSLIYAGAQSPTVNWSIYAEYV